MSAEPIRPGIAPPAAGAVTPDPDVPMATSVPDAMPTDAFVPDESETISPTPAVTVGNMMFEDFFPPLDLTEEQKDGISAWLIRDLKSCVRNVNRMRNKWATYRAVFMLEYIEKFYPSMGFGAEFASGVLCDKTLAGMDRLKKAVFSPRPLFIVDDKTSNLESIEFIHRAEWFMHTVFEEDLEIQDVIGPGGIFEYIIDGSMILEADQMYEKVPQRTIKTYLTEDALLMDESKILDKSEFDKALEQISQGQPARVLIEEDLVTKNGLQVFLVDKVDHLIPPNVYSDRDIRFRGRRMYLTEADLRLLASDGVGWYEQEDVDKVLGERATRRQGYNNIRSGDDKSGALANMEQVYQGQSGLLAYEWRNEDERLSADKETQPYENTFAVYRTLCKYAYKTGNDEKGLIPKYCTFDIDGESGVILRARTYPHFHEKKNYFHFKLGHAPKSYYGFGYGARLINDDFIESNAIDLYFDGTAMATFRPFVCVHPEEGGMVPFRDGLGPGKVGFVRNIGEFQPFEIPAPSPALIQHLLPVIKTRTENKTSVTSLVQGRTESSDPRSPAQKTRMLLAEAGVGIESQIEDFNTTGWSPLANFVWAACGENLIYQGKDAFENKITFPGTLPELEILNKITLEEMQKKIVWKGQAGAIFLNAEAREVAFLRHFQFFMPLLQTMGQFQPELFKKYFLRWVIWGGQELQVRGLRYLLPTAEELGDIPAQDMAKAWDKMNTFLKSGQTPEGPGLEGGR